MNKQKVLFVCTQNSARSQMAEALLRYYWGDNYEVFSAGTHPWQIHPLAVQVLSELGISTQGQFSKHIDDLEEEGFDLVVTVCDRAKESCPFVPGAHKIIHKSFPDPAGWIGTQEEKTESFRQVRDQIRDWLKNEFSPQ